MDDVRTEGDLVENRPTNENTSIHALYEQGQKILDGLQARADRQERKAQVIIAAVALLTSASMTTIPSTITSGGWYIAFHLVLLAILIIAVLSIYHCIKVLDLRPYKYDYNFEGMYKAHWDDTEDAFKRQIISNLGVTIRDHVNTFESKATDLKKAIGLLKWLAAGLCIFALFRPLYGGWDQISDYCNPQAMNETYVHEAGNDPSVTDSTGTTGTNPPPPPPTDNTKITINEGEDSKK